MSDQPAPDERAVAAAREEFRAAYRRVVEAINAVAAPRRAFALATEFGAEVGEFEKDAAGVRRAQVRRIRDDEALDLARLGASLEPPMTKQRLGKLLNQAEPAATTPEG